MVGTGEGLGRELTRKRESERAKKKRERWIKRKRKSWF